VPIFGPLFVGFKRNNHILGRWNREVFGQLASQGFPLVELHSYGIHEHCVGENDKGRAVQSLVVKKKIKRVPGTSEFIPK
jgi:hypothetical protein